MNKKKFVKILKNKWMKWLTEWRNEWMNECMFHAVFYFKIVFAEYTYSYIQTSISLFYCFGRIFFFVFVFFLFAINIDFIWCCMHASLNKITNHIHNDNNNNINNIIKSDNNINNKIQMTQEVFQFLNKEPKNKKKTRKMCK